MVPMIFSAMRTYTTADNVTFVVCVVAIAAWLLYDLVFKKKDRRK